MIVTDLPSIYFSYLLLRDFSCAPMPNGISLAKIPPASTHHTIAIHDNVLMPDDPYR